MPLLVLVCGIAVGLNLREAERFVESTREAQSPPSLQFNEYLGNDVLRSPEWSTYSAVLDADEINDQSIAERDLLQEATKVWVPWLQDEMTAVVYERRELFRPTPVVGGSSVLSTASSEPLTYLYRHGFDACWASDATWVGNPSARDEYVATFLAGHPLDMSELVGENPVSRARSEAAAEAIAPLLFTAALDDACGHRA